MPYSVESVITTMMITRLLSEPYDGDFTAEHYRDIHRTIMDNIYDWSGEVRTVDLSKKGTRFHSAEGLDRAMQLSFAHLNEQNYFLVLAHEEYAAQIAEFFTGLNLLHPFCEGNGLAQRVLIVQLVERAGDSIDFSECDNDLLMIATIHAAHGVLDYLRDFFIEAIH